MGYDIVGYAAGSWGTLGNAFFFFSALFSDILLIRFCLTLAYGFFLVQAFLGLPNVEDWGKSWDKGEPSFLPWGLVFWFTLSGSFHLFSLLRLIWDERTIHLEGDDEHIWRCLYRRSGMGRLEFLQLRKRGAYNKYKAGQTIYLKGFSEPCLHLIVEGVVELCTTDAKGDYFQLYSGEMFDYKLFNLFGIYIGFDADIEDTSIYQVNAKTDCVLFTWHAQQISEMAFRVSPSVSGYWRNLVLFVIGTGFTRRGRHNYGNKARDSNGVFEDESWYAGARTRDMTRPLEAAEVPDHSLRAYAKWVWGAFGPVPPVGLRHTALPQSGMKAAARILAFAHQDNFIVRFTRGSMLTLSRRTEDGTEPGSELFDASHHPPPAAQGALNPQTSPVAPMNIVRQVPQQGWPSWATPHGARRRLLDMFPGPPSLHNQRSSHVLQHTGSRDIGHADARGLATSRSEPLADTADHSHHTV